MHRIMWETNIRKIIVVICMMISLTSCGANTSDDSGKTVLSGHSATGTSLRAMPSGTGEDSVKKEEITYRFNDYEPIRYEDVVWTAMSEKMSKGEFEEFCEYLPALTGESVVHWQGDEDDDAYTEEGFQGSDKTIRQIFHMLQGKIMSVSFCDMTRDGVKELIIAGSCVSYPYMIIHKKESEFYGDAYVRRQFQSPQKSGYFWWGKESGHWYRLTFQDERFEMTAIAGITEETKENGKDREKTYYIHNKKADAKSYKRWEEENLTGGIKEYELASLS